MNIEIINRDIIKCVLCESPDYRVYLKVTNIPRLRENIPLTEKYVCAHCADEIHNAVEAMP